MYVIHSSDAKELPFEAEDCVFCGGYTGVDNIAGWIVVEKIPRPFCSQSSCNPFLQESS